MPLMDSSVLCGKTQHEGHHVHKGEELKFYGLFTFVTFVYFVFRKN